jgi:hypothetical protein
VSKILVVCLLCTTIVHSAKRTLVLVDNWSVRETHSTYFRELRGKNLSFFAFINCSLILLLNRFFLIFNVYLSYLPIDLYALT